MREELLNQEFKNKLHNSENSRRIILVRNLASQINVDNICSLELLNYLIFKRSRSEEPCPFRNTFIVADVLSFVKRLCLMSRQLLV